MKKSFFLLLMVASTIAAFALPPVNEKVTSAFKTSFPNAKHVIWTEFENFYQVYFEKDDKQYRLCYDLNGNVKQSRSDYRGDKLNPFLAAKLLKRFAGKTIFMVNEMNTDDETYYLVHMEGEHDWTQVRCDPAGNMTVLAKLKKG